MAQLQKILCHGTCDGLAFRIAHVWVRRAVNGLKCPVCGGPAKAVAEEDNAPLTPEARRQIHETVDAYVERSGAVQDVNDEIARENATELRRRPRLPPEPPPWRPPLPKRGAKR